MKQMITLVLFAAGIAANAQSEKTENYKKQISRTPYIVWEWVDEDSTRAYQDSIPGIMKFFQKDEFEGERWESVHYFYDVEEVYAGKTTRQLIRDWNSFDLDTMYYTDLLDEYHPYSGDSFRTNVRPSYGVMWNEIYTVDSSMVIMDDAYLDLDTLKSGEVVFHLMYMRIIEDTLYPEASAMPGIGNITD